MKNIYILAVITLLLLTYGLVQEQNTSIPGSSPWTQNDDRTLLNAYKHKQSNIQVEGEGIVTKILADDLDGSKHQRFILKISHGQTLLVAHNIDLAPRINRLKTGDTVASMVNMNGIQKVVLSTGRIMTRVVAILPAG